MIKEIRILSGRHRGATLPLTAGSWRIGCDDAAAVHISDWQHAAVNLTIAEDGRICWQADGATDAVAVTEHQIIHFDAIALCIGAVGGDAAEPALPVAAAATPERHKRRWLALSALAVPAALLSSALLAMQPPHADPGTPLDGLRRRLPALLAGIGQGALQVHQQDGLIVVQGVVRDGAEAGAVRSLLHEVAPERSVAHLAIVNEVLASITESLREPTLTPHYEGKGIFVVSGTTRDSAVVRRRLAQLAADLGPAVTRLDAQVTEVRPGWSVADSDSALDTDGVRYVQSLDGSKHFPGAPMAAAAPVAVATPH
ncbi:hypothetical protein [Duganella sp.]|uniref:hypothetical protein n=1 Tax=Duganella sp. TaxID=1904440 RepID=UPI0031E27CAD